MSTALVLRWTGRSLGLLGFLFILIFILAEGFPAFWKQLPEVQVELAGMVLMLIGLLLGWKHEGWGAALIALGWLVFYVIEQGRPPWPFTAFLIVAALYAYGEWQERLGGVANGSVATSSLPPPQSAINEAEWNNSANWTGPKWFAFYFSKRDSRAWVPKRIRWMGWTINLGNRKGMTWFIALLLGIIGLLAVLAFPPVGNTITPGLGPVLERAAIIAVANQAVHEFVHLDPEERNGNEIPKRLWATGLAQLHPLRVVFDRMNTMIVLREDQTSEEGLYVDNPVSSYAPGLDARFVAFDKLSQPADNAFGALYRYRLAKLQAPAVSTDPLPIEWQKLAVHGRLRGRELVTVDGRAALRIENTNSAPRRVALLEIGQPPITALRYALTGEIKYENVQGGGYLELWSYFTPLRPGLPEAQFFSRTLAETGFGPLAKITGTCGWRNFSLPFDRTGTTNPPSRIVLNLFLPGRGVVFVGPLQLRQFSESTKRAE